MGLNLPIRRVLFSTMTKFDGCTLTLTGAENSEVLPFRSVAVAMILSPVFTVTPAGNVKDAVAGWFAWVSR